MTLRKVLRKEEFNVESSSTSGRTMSWRVRTRWRLTLECGHQLEVTDYRGRRVQRVRCKACDAAAPADVDPVGVTPGLALAPPSGLQRFMDGWCSEFRAERRDQEG